MSLLSFHHTGLLVTNIEESLKHYKEVFGEESISEIYDVSSQKVRVCFIKNGSDSYLELVQPATADSPVSRMLEKRMSYYHAAYKVRDIQEAINYLEELNYKAMPIFSSEAFAGSNCVFLFTPEGHLVELIEFKN